MISAGRHPKQEVADAVQRAEQAGLRIRVIHRGHRWGEVACGACLTSTGIWSTPRNPGTHAKQIDRLTRSHTHI